MNSTQKWRMTLQRSQVKRLKWLSEKTKNGKATGPDKLPVEVMCHSMKLYERGHENRLRNVASINEEQFGFVKGKSTTDAIFALR